MFRLKMKPLENARSQDNNDGSLWRILLNDWGDCLGDAHGWSGLEAGGGTAAAKGVMRVEGGGMVTGGKGRGS